MADLTLMLQRLSEQMEAQGVQLQAQLQAQGAQLQAQMEAQGAQLQVQMEAQLQAQGAQLQAQMEAQGAQLQAQMEAQLQAQDAKLQALDAKLQALDAKLQAQGAQLQAQGAQLLSLQLPRVESPRGGGSGAAEGSSRPISGKSSPHSPHTHSPLHGGGGGGSGGGGGGPRSPSSAGKSPGSSGSQAAAATAALRAAFAAAPPPSPPLTIALGADSRSLPMDMQGALQAHRLRTAPRVQDFMYEVIDDLESAVLPCKAKGYSVFVVASLDPGVVRAAHAARGLASKGHAGCLARPLATLPPELQLTFDSVLESLGGGAGGVAMVFHATVSPTARMTFSAFEGAFRAWSGAQVCVMEGGGGQESEEGSSSEEGEGQEIGLTRLLTKHSAPMVAAKLRAHAASLCSGCTAGGSPG